MRHSIEFHRGARGQRDRRRGLNLRVALAILAAIGGLVGWPLLRAGTVATTRAPDPGTDVTRRFGFCHRGGGTNCVVDGDTFWMDGERIRIADIDAPETHPPRCPDEARLGKAATQRLRALLNAGPVRMEIAGRDTDRYGRKLRVVRRGGRSLGAQLVKEGLAREWTGRRQPWC